MVPKSKHFTDLPWSVLELIFQHLDAHERVCTAPLICKYAKAVCDASCTLFSTVELSTASFDSLSDEERQMRSLILWLRGRRGKIRNLKLSLWEAPSLLLLAYRAAYVAAASLEQLSLIFEGEGGHPVRLDSFVRLLPNLTKLVVSASHIAVGTAVRNASSLRMLALHADIFDGMWLSDGRTGDQSVQEPPSPSEGPLVSSLPPSLAKLSFGGQLTCFSRHMDYTTALPYGLGMASTLQGLAVEGRRLRDEDMEILAGLTGLRERHLTGCGFPSFHHVSALTGLKLLYLSGSSLLRAAKWEEALAPLRQLIFLSISDCGLPTLPPAILESTCLEGLHVEGNNFMPLPPGPYLAQLKELALDWQSLFASHATLARHAARLSHLIMAGSHSPIREGMRPAAVSPAARAWLVDSTLDSLAALPELRCFTHVLEERPPSSLEYDSWLRPCVALCLLRLGRRCLGLQLNAVQGDKYGWIPEGGRGPRGALL